MKIIKFILNIFKSIGLYFKYFFCKHNMQSVEDSKYYFHFKCTKCSKEFGMNNFKIK